MSELLSGVYCIENQYLSKTFNIEKGKIFRSAWYNKLDMSSLEKSGSVEEFVLRFGSAVFKTTVKSSKLRVESAKICKNKEKSTLTLTFEKVFVKSEGFSVSLVYTLNDGEKFCRKHLEIECDKSNKGKALLDSIDLECFELNEKHKKWTLPKQMNSHISGFLMSVGQPVYVDSFFFGCEFPLSYNRIEKERLLITFYSGKSLNKLTEKGRYITYKAVFGVSESNEFANIQKSFFSYIRGISKPIKLRVQYNSWYDNMLNINVQNITESFLNIDKGLTTHGTKALDSYVMDDGWNDYSADFWKFNKKFPDGLSEFRALSESLGSRFGLWLGPRGGYTTDTIKFARQIEKGGNGFVNKRAFDICVGSKKYVDKTADMLLGFVKDYNLNYFKLDGFAQRPCKDKKHDHTRGGFENMYFFTDVWEKWIAFFERVYETDENFWINLTSYTPPSPWFLQWCNSLWMQISNDHGFEGEKNCDKDRLLTYRDNRYYDFYNIRQFQVPQYALYNHDPIYGKDAKVKMTDDEFREYLFTMAVRGTCFWELYYSHTLFNDAKWRINNCVLTFIEENIKILSNSVIFGVDPVKGGVYGYSCFGSDEGIVCLRNSSSEKKKYTLVIDEKIGAEKSLENAIATLIIPYTCKRSEKVYSYGDSMETELDAFETKIYHFNKKPKAMEISYVKAMDERTLEVSFNQFVNVENITCGDNIIEEIILLEDYMTVKITFKYGFEKINAYTLSGVRDILGNNKDILFSFDYYKNYVVDGGVFGCGDFSLHSKKIPPKKAMLFSQGNEVSLSVDSQGRVIFTIGNYTLVSRNTLREEESVTAVRERNGVMKIYIGKKLDSGKISDSAFLSGANADFVSETTTVYNKAFAFDEIIE